MKSIQLLLITAGFASAMAQPISTNPPGAAALNREQAIRQALDRSYAQLTNAPAAPGAAPAPALPAPPATTAAPPTRPIRTPDASPQQAPPPAIPAFPTPPARRPGQGNVAVPPAPGAAPTDPVAGKPAAPQVPGAVQPGANGKADAANGGNGNGEEDIFPPGMVKFQDSDVLQVLDIYQEMTGRTVVRPTSLPATKISVRSQTPLTRREAIQLLDTILAMNGITMIPQGDKTVKAVAQGTASQEAPRFEDPDKDLDDTTRYITKVIQLKNAVPRDVTAALQPLSKMPNSIMAIDSSGILVLRDYEENVKRMEELLDRIDVVGMKEYEPVVIPIKYALASDIAQVLSSLTAGGGSATTVGASRAPAGLSTQSGLQGGGRGTTGYGGIGGAQGGIPGQTGFGNTAGGFGGSGLGGGLGGGVGGASTGTRGSFQDRLRSIVNRAAAGAAGEIVVLENVKIISDERTNSLLVFATKGDIETITNIISKLDVVLAQVLIEAIIMEVSLDNTLNYGFSYLQKKAFGNDKASGIGALNNGTFLSPGAFTSVGSNAVASLPSGFSYFANIYDFDATATAIATDNRINVLSRPRIQTSHAVQADLFVGETRPYITGTYSYFGGGGPSSQYSQLQIGITLSVLPLVNADGLVVMDIRQKIQSIGGFTKIDNNDIPTTIDREANAKVAVQDGETVILGGFISTDRSKSASGIPLLKDIPVLGNLFRSTSKTLNRKELMILIRPTVLPNPQIAAKVAQREKGKLPGITAAERENKRIERRAQKQLNLEDAAEQKKLDEEDRRDLEKSQKENKRLQKNLHPTAPQPESIDN